MGTKFFSLLSVRTQQMTDNKGKYKVTQQDARLEDCKGAKVSEESAPFTFRVEETLEMDAAGSSETSISIHQTTRRQISYNL
jgi:hypothetical protein